MVAKGGHVSQEEATTSSVILGLGQERSGALYSSIAS